MDVLVAANMINLPRLVQLAEFALKPVRLLNGVCSSVC